MATTSSDGRDVQFRDKPLPKFAVELKGREHFGQWLRGRETLDASKLGARFGGYTTNDVEFVRSAKDRLQTLLWELREPLLRPANYLLEAAPGSGKSFFVGEFARELQANLNRDALYIEKNLSAYPSIDAAFTDIVLDVLLGLASRRDIVLFLDEVDTEIDGRRIFQKLIAPINGERFFFQEKQLSFGKQNVVGFYALSSGRDDLHHAPKWPDFLSRIPAGHRFELPAFDSPFERLFRALGILRRGRVKVERATVHALMYLSLREWRSSRELDQGIELAKARLRDPTKVLDLEHVALSLADVREVSVRANVSIAHEVNDVISIVG